MIAVKLGGSVITDKASQESIDQVALDRAAQAIAAYDGAVVLVHGGGSFGHPAAQRHGLSPSQGTHDTAAIREVHAAMRRLNDAVITALDDHGAAPIPVHPLSLVHRSGTGELEVPAAHLSTMLQEGLVPVLHGDVIAHAGVGASILSGDELIAALSAALPIERIGVCSTEPGVLDDTGAVIEEISAFEDVATTLGGSDAPDVTGGMAGKVKTLLDSSAPASIFGLADLEGFLAGNQVGTSIA